MAEIKITGYDKARIKPTGTGESFLYFTLSETPMGEWVVLFGEAAAEIINPEFMPPSVEGNEIMVVLGEPLDFNVNVWHTALKAIVNRTNDLYRLRIQNQAATNATDQSAIDKIKAAADRLKFE